MPPIPFARRALVEELEPRLLFSADFAPALADALAPQTEQRMLDASGEYAGSNDSQQSAQHARLEVVFIDLRVQGYEKILADIQTQNTDGHSIEVVLIDPERDGIAQIGEFLSQRQDVEAVHLISHGSAGSVQLGAGELNFDSLLANAAPIKQWGNALSAEADILIYGCDLASTEAGQSLVDALSKLTGADVAASDDLTGAAELGGDWVLEYRSGDIQTQVVVSEYGVPGWQGILATYTVTSTNNTGVGSLRQAILDANGNTGTDTIAFNIPLNDPNHVYYRDNGVAGSLGTPVATTLADGSITDFDSDYLAGTARSWYSIALGGSADLRITEAVILDGTTQPGYSAAKGPIIELNAAGVTASDPNALTIETSGVTVRGLVINRAGDDAIEIDAFGGGNTITGNYLGTDVSGTMALGNQYGITVKTDSNTISGNIIAGNNTTAASYGIGFWQDADLNIVQGNFIGVGADGIKALGNRDGILFAASQTPDNNLIGGTTTATANLIANNTQNGINALSGTGNAFMGNAIHNNSVLGINIGTAGVTANDAGDGDTGANNLQNFPVLTLARTDGAQLILAGTFNSTANNFYRIEFFSSASLDSTGYGEGQRYLGSINLATDGSGNATINANLATAVAVGEFITATATRSNNTYSTFTDTSEFSRGVAAISLTQATIVVDTAADTLNGDTTSLSTLLANKGADGKISLREAIIAANNTANGLSGADRIHFNIPDPLIGGAHTITLAYDGPNAGTTPDALPTITQALIIDGTTDPDFAGTPIVELNGNNIGSLVKGLTLGAGSDGSTIKGLIVNRFTGTGIEISNSNNHTIQGNWIGLDKTGTAAAANGVKGIYALNATGLLIGTNADGSNDAAERNVISGNAEQGIYFDNTDNSTIAGNYVGTNSAGTGDVNGSVANTAQSGVFLTNGSSGNTIGGTTAASRNILSGNNHFGFEVLFSSQNNQLQGNYIGTDITGLLALGNINGGAVFWNAGTGNVFGGNVTGARNVIAGNTYSGVVVGNASSGATIQGNYIGVGADGSTALGNGSYGISVEGGSTGTRIGSNADGINDAEERNIIANNNIGVSVSGSTTTGTSILSNSIHGNTSLGIDLGTVGVTANDAGDGDTGANNLQNFPVLTSAVSSGGQVTIAGSLNSTTNSYFRIEFFASVSQDASGYGEGLRYLGYANVATNASGNATINAILTASVAANEYISATATKTDATYSTFTDSSEFAFNVAATVTNTAPVLDSTKSPALTAQDEDAGAPVGAVGTLVSSLVDFASPAGQVDNVIDPDSGALLGIAVTAANTTNGSWWYSTNNGGAWNVLGAVSESNARLLAADASTRLYFQPNANYNGTFANAITFRAWDQTSGSNGGTANTSVNGGASAFSTATDTASLTVSAVNDPPIAANDTQSVSEGGILSVSAPGVLGNDTDIDSVAGSPAPGATLSYVAASDGDGVWNNQTATTGYDWTLTNFGTQVTHTASPGSAYTGITAAYRFSGTSSGGWVPTLQNIVGDPTNNSASFEVWFRTDTLTGQHIIFETGGSSSGASLYLDGSFLKFATRTGGAAADEISVDLAGLYASPTSEFIQLVAVIDQTSTQMKLYLDGVLRASGSFTGANGTDWTGNDGAGLGMAYQDVNPSPAAGSGNLDGDIAIVRFYERALTGAEAAANFSAIASAPLTVTAVQGNTANVGNPVSLPSGALLTMNGNGSYTYNPNSAFEYLAMGQTTTDSFAYTVSDSGGQSSSATVTITITGQNDAPLLYSIASPTLLAQNEDANAPVGVVGTLVSSLVDFANPAGQLDNVADPDSGALTGIAITAADTTNGVWHYSTNNGASWNALGAVANNNARLLAADVNTRLYFQPNANYNGTLTNAITFRAWDQTSGSNGALADTSSNGGTTAFSTATDTASLTVNPVNDAPTFGTGNGMISTAVGTGADIAYDVTVQPDGKILLAGSARVGTTDDFALTRYNADGSLDLGFGTNGIVTTAIGAGADWAHGVVVQADGKIVVAGRAHNGSNYDLAVVRYNADGTLDTSFGGGTGKVTVAIGTGDDVGNMVVLQSDGKIIVSARARVGTTDDFAVVRLNTDGTLDAGFGTGGIVTTAIGTGHETGQRLTLQTDGKIVVAGRSFNGSNYDFAVVRYNTNGSLDTSFGGSGKVTTAIGAGDDYGSGVAVQADGKILVGGFARVGATDDFAVVRYLSDGTLDAGFGIGGKITTSLGAGNDQGHGLSLQADGKILVGGTGLVGATSAFALMRYLPDGSLDTGFGNAGIVTAAVGTGNDAGLEMTVQADGKILLAGSSFNGANTDFALVRVNSDGSLDSGFDTAILNGNPTFTEGGTPVVLDSDVRVFDTELSAADNFNGATLTLARNGGANAQDLFSATGTLSALTQGSALMVGGTTIGVVTTNSAGTLMLSFNANATQARVNQTLQSIAYANSSDTPPASARIDWTFSDGNAGAQGSGGALSATGSTTIRITAVNDSPAGADKTVVATEDTVYTFALADFGFTDTDGHSLLAVKIATLPAAGSLALNGVAVTAGQFVSAADIGSGLLRFTPAANANGAGYASFTFQVQDNGGTANGGVHLDPTPNTITVNVSAANDAPVNIVPGTQTTSQNTTLVFSAANGNAISIADIDAGAGALQVTLSATNGALTLAGTAGLSFTSGDGTADATMSFTGTTANINAALNGLSFTPTAGYTGSATLQIVTNDQGNTGSGGALSDTDVVFVSVVGNAFWLSTDADVSASGTPGITSWSAGQIIQFGNPAFALEPGTTSGTFSSAFNLNGFVLDGSAAIDALHYVGSTITVGSGAATMTLQAGDLLFSMATAETLPGAGVIDPDDLVLFRPSTPGNYAAGTFSILLDNVWTGGNNLVGITLVEKTTVVGGSTLNAGTFLYHGSSGGFKREIYWGTPTGVGAGISTGISATAPTMLVDGNAINITGGGSGFNDFDLVESTITIGGVTLPTGTLIATLAVTDGGVGSNNIPAQAHDVFYLTLTSTGVGATSGNATLLFQGADVGLNTAAEEIAAFTLAQLGTSTAPVLTLPGSALNYTENAVATVIDATATVTDADSANFAGGTLFVNFTANGSANDRLTIRNQGTGAGQIGVSGSNVTYGGVTIGSFAGGTDGSTPLTVSLNTNATVAATQALLRNVTFQNVSDAPSTLARTVSVVLTDGSGGTSNTATKTINITSVNDAPAGSNGTITATEDTTYTFTLADFGFTDADGHALMRVHFDTLPAVGTLRWNNTAFAAGNWVAASDIASGLLTYVPTANANGAAVASFTFRVQDDGGTANGGVDTDTTPNTITINITALNDAPVINSNGGGATAAISVAENTTAVTTVSATDIDGGTPVYSISGGADAALFTIDSTTGVLTFNTAPNFEAPADAGANNIYDVTVQVADGNGGFDTQAINVTVTNVNEAPTLASPIADQTATEDAAFSFTFNAATFNDVDAGDTLTYSASGLPAWLAFNAATRTFSGTPANADVGTVTLTVRATDTTGTFVEDQFDIVVANSNDAPAVTPVDLGSINEDGSLLITQAMLLTGASDADGDTLAAINLTLTSGSGTLTDHGNGTWTFTPTANWNGSASFGFAVSDGTVTTPNTASLAVVPVNDEQIIVTNTGTTVAENATGTVITSAMLATNDVDNTPAQLVYTLTGAPANGTLRLNGVALGAGGTFTQADINAGLLTYDHNGSESSADSLSFIVDDGVGVTSSGTFNLSVTPVNDNAPVITSYGGSATATLSVAENTVAVTSVTATDADLPAQTLTYSIIGGADAALFTIDANTGGLSFIAAPNREVAGDVGGNHVYDVTVQVSDGSLTDTQQIAITVTDVDEFDVGTVSDADSSTNLVAENAVTGTAVGITAFASDADATNNAITYSLDNDAGGRFAVDSNTGVVTVASTLDYETNASHSVTVRASSADGSFAIQSFTIVVTDVSEAGIGALSDINVAANTVAENSATGTAVGVTAFADDPDGTDTVSYSLDDDAGGRFAIDANTGVVTMAGAIDREAAGVYSITVRATSTDTSTTTQVFGITIGDVDEYDVSPVIDTDAATNAVDENTGVGSFVGITAFASDADATSNSITYSLDDNAGGRFTIHATSGVVTVADGSLLDYEAATSHAITLRASSSDGSFDILTLTINVAPVNDHAPVITSDGGGATTTLNVAENTTAVTTVTAFDADLPAQTLTYAIVGGVDAGLFSIDSNSGALSFNVPPDFETPADAGLDNVYEVIVRVFDGAFGDSQTLSVTVTPVNDNAPMSVPVILAPVAEDSGARLITQAELLAGASDADGDSLTATGLTISSGSGTLADNGDGTWTYTPAANDDTSAGFSYTVTDGSQTTPGSATLDITPVNDAPVASHDTASGGEDSTLAGNVLANDGDVDSASLTAVLVSGPAHGALVLNADGSFTYTPDADWHGGDSFTYKAHDGALDSSVATVSITVNPANDAPAVQPVSLGRINEDGSLLITQAMLLAGANDVDGDSLAAISLALASGSGALVDNGDGSWTFAPDADWNGAASFSFAVDDGSATTPNTASLDVDPANDAPILAAIGNQAVGEGQLLSFTASASDIDVPANTLTYSLAGAPAGATIDAGTGAFAWTPTEAQGPGVYTFDVIVSDGVATDSETISVAVHEINAAPAGTDKIITTNEDTAYIFTAADFGFTDPDDAPANNLLAVRIAALPAAGSLTLSGVAVTAGQNISVVDIHSGLLRFTPAADAFGTGYASFTFQVRDDGGTANGGVDLDPTPNTITLDVTAVNDAPTTTPVALSGIAEDSGPRLITQAQLLANAADVDGPGLSAVGLSIASGSGTLADNGDGTWTYTPAADDDTAAGFDYTIVDGSGGSTAGSASLDIAPVNDAPTASDASLSTNEDTPYGGTLPAFHDIDSAVVTYALASGAAHGTAFVNGDGSFGYAPDSHYHGADSFTYTVSDGAGGSTTYTVTVTVDPVNDAPSVLPVDLGNLNEDGSLVITQAMLLAGANDVDGDSLAAINLTLSSGSGTLTDNGNGSWTFTPATNWNGGASFGFAVDDGTTTTPNTASLIVDPVNDAPSVLPVDLGSLNEDGSLVITQAMLLAGASDADGNALAAINLVLATGSGTLTDNGNGSWTFTPATNWNGGASFGFAVDDGTTTTPNTASLIVDPVNDAPTLVANTLNVVEGGTVVLGTANLNTSDVEQAAPALTYTVSNVLHGQFERTTAPGTAILGFTQADIDAGLVAFVHDAGEFAPSYEVSVSDGSATTGPQAATILFTQVAEGIHVSAASASATTEAGGTVSFDVTLNSQPFADVTVFIVSGSPAEGTASVSSLTFTAANWNVAQQVTVTGVDDFIDDGDQAYTIQLQPAVSADRNYAALDAGDVALSNLDDDTAGVLVTPAGGLVTDEAGRSDTFSVVLTSQPLADVVIQLDTSNPGEGVLSTNALTFTASDWNIPRVVTVTGVNDTLNDGGVAYQVIAAPALSADSLYNGIGAGAVDIVNLSAADPVPINPPTPGFGPAPQPGITPPEPLREPAMPAQPGRGEAGPAVVASGISGPPLPDVDFSRAEQAANAYNTRLKPGVLPIYDEPAHRYVLSDARADGNILLRLLEFIQASYAMADSDDNAISPAVRVEISKDQNFRVEILSQGAQIAAVSLSVGAVWWALRAGGLFASLLTSLPAWRSFDVLPVLSREADDDEDDAWGLGDEAAGETSAAGTAKASLT